MKKNIIKLCPVCKNEFEGRNNAWSNKLGYNRFCSRKCFGTYQLRRVLTKCQRCSKSISVTPARLKDGRGKYCSKHCQYLDKKGIPAWNKGKKCPQISKALKGRVFTPEWKEKIRQSLLGRTSAKKGKHNGLADWIRLNGSDDYRNLHKQFNRIYGQPQYCEHCKRTDLERYLYHWANISGKYSKEREDWLRLCYKCHVVFDKANRQDRQMMDILK